MNAPDSPLRANEPTGGWPTRWLFTLRPFCRPPVQWQARSRSRVVAVALLGCFFSGCSICETGYIHDYATVGGKWARSNPAEGRVGSSFSDPGYVAPSVTAGEVSYESEGVYYGEEVGAYGGVGTGYGMEVDAVYGDMLPDSVIELDGSGSQMEVIPPAIELNEDW